MSSKPATIKEIARRLNVSVSTVSRALHDHPGIGLRTKMQVQQMAATLQYEPNQAAISFKQGKTLTIGVILPNLREEFFSIAINAIEDVCGMYQYTVLIGQSHDSPEREQQIAETMRKHRVDGVLVSLSKGTNQYEHFEQLAGYNIPCVFFDRAPSLDTVYSVTCDMKKASEDLIDLLAERKHSYIGFINGPSSLVSSAEREQGIREAAARNKLKDLTIYTTDLSAAEIRTAMQRLLLLKKRPTAIITFNDYTALEAIKFAREQGIKINHDIYFVSYANLPITGYLDAGLLASVEQFPYEQAEKATEMLMQLIAKKPEAITNRRQVLEAKVVVN